ncbi:MAG: formate/nitrite transporter family protein [Clostridiales bacterium]|nr:formate/nitrite transporter family protein [Clostridiales bacterium]
MKKLSSFVYSIIGGACIGIGGTIYLSLDNRIAGAILFALGLFTICVNGFNLFTGKVPYLFENKSSYLLFLGSVWLGNLVGAGGVGYLIRATRVSGIAEKAAALCTAKLNDNLLSIFILSIFCGILMYIAVDNFRINSNDFGRYIGIFTCVPVFILCGFEHCIANMFYFSVANMWGAKTLLYLVVMTLGNGVGGVLFPVARQLKNRAEARDVRDTAGKL